MAKKSKSKRTKSKMFNGNTGVAYCKEFGSGAKPGHGGKSGKAINPPVKGDNVFENRMHAEDQYEKEYSFKKNKKPVRSPAPEWEYEYLHSDQSHWDDAMKGSLRKMALESGAVHGFGHGRSQINGNLRLSGHPKAHRLGASSSKVPSYRRERQIG